MRAIWREAAAIQTPRFFRQNYGARFTTAAPPIARKRDSYSGLRNAADPVASGASRDGLRSGPAILSRTTVFAAGFSGLVPLAK